MADDGMVNSVYVRTKALIDVIDGYHDVPTADATTDTVMRDVIGRKTDAAQTTVGTTRSLMGYLKGTLNQLATILADTNELQGDWVNGGRLDVLIDSIITKIDAVDDYVDSEVAAIKAKTDLIASTTCAKKTISSLASGDTTLFTVSGGAVRIITLIGHITTGIQSGANNIQLWFYPTGGAASAMCAVVDSASAAVRKIFYITGVQAEAMVLSPDEGIVFGNVTANIRLTPGTIAFNSVALKTGVIDWYIEYQPLATGATIAPV